VKWFGRRPPAGNRSPASTPATELQELWRTTIPGDVDNRYLCDLPSKSLFATDGWGIAYAALRVHRLDLRSGVHLADLRTRHQSVGAMAMHQGDLLVATDSRLFQIRVSDFSVVRQWDKGLVRYAMQLIPAGNQLVAANWLAPSVGIFHLDTGRTRRLTVGGQPLLFRFGDEVKVIAGFDGGMWTLDLDRGQLTRSQKTAPLTNVAVGEHIWATLAGRRQGGQGEPPVWTKRGTAVITRLTGDRWTAAAGGPVKDLVCDDRRAVLWCLTGVRPYNLEAISQRTGRVLASFTPTPGKGIGFCHVDPAAGIALQADSSQEVRGSILIRSTSTLVCLALPDVDE
jgi:hypothetical protein